MWFSAEIWEFSTETDSLTHLVCNLAIASLTLIIPTSYHGHTRVSCHNQESAYDGYFEKKKSTKENLFNSLLGKPSEAHTYIILI